MADDTYSVIEAAKILGVSERRVRQLGETGRLRIVAHHPVRLAALDVLAEKEKRPARARRQETATAEPVALDPETQLRAMVSAVLQEMLPLMLEAKDSAARRIEEHLTTELAAARAEAVELRAKLEKRKGKGKRRKKRK